MKKIAVAVAVVVLAAVTFVSCAGAFDFQKTRSVLACGLQVRQDREAIENIRPI